MQDPEIWDMISKHMAGEESILDKEIFQKWLNQSEKNNEFFFKIKSLWDNPDFFNEPVSKKDIPLKFRKRFTITKIKDFILKKTLGNLVGFVIGMWVTGLFSHFVLERRSIKNLFGLSGRKQVVVNDIPEWLQGAISILAGYIVLELINHFFETKKYLVVWEYLKKNIVYSTIKK